MVAGPQKSLAEKMISYDYLFKLVLVGDSGVGKSCLLVRFAVRGERIAQRLLGGTCENSADPVPGCRAGRQVQRQLYQHNWG